MPESAKQGCPQIDTLERRLRGEEGENLKVQAESHVACCASCATEMALLNEFLESKPAAHEEASLDWIEKRIRPIHAEALPADAPSWGERFMLWFRGSPVAWAGAAALALATILVVRDTPPGVPGGLGTGTTIERSGQLRAEEPVGRIDSAPQVLAVAETAGAAAYRFELREVDQTVIWSGESASPEIALPAEAAAQAMPGRTLIWLASALDESGDVIAETAPTRFAVEREAIP